MLLYLTQSLYIRAPATEKHHIAVIFETRVDLLHLKWFGLPIVSRFMHLYKLRCVVRTDADHSDRELFKNEVNDQRTRQLSCCCCCITP